MGLLKNKIICLVNFLKLFCKRSENSIFLFHLFGAGLLDPLSRAFPGGERLPDMDDIKEIKYLVRFNIHAGNGQQYFQYRVEAQRNLFWNDH